MHCHPTDCLQTRRCQVADIESDCPETYGGKSISGNFTTQLHHPWFEDRHQSLEEDTHFMNIYGNFDFGDLNVAKRMTQEDAASVFHNHWMRWLFFGVW